MTRHAGNLGNQGLVGVKYKKPDIPHTYVACETGTFLLLVFFITTYFCVCLVIMAARNRTTLDAEHKILYTIPNQFIIICVFSSSQRYKNSIFIHNHAVF